MGANQEGVITNMGILSDLSVTSATYSSATKILNVVGIAFAENQYSGIVEVSTNGSTWKTPITYQLWSDSLIICSFAPSLSAGTYRIRVTNGDNEVSAILLSAFTSLGSTGCRRDGLRIALSLATA
jgi:hypothetical protein